MARTRNNPRWARYCVFCEYWTGDADLKFVSSSAGYEYESQAVGKCMKFSTNRFAHNICGKYEPNAAARRMKVI